MESTNSTKVNLIKLILSATSVPLAGDHVVAHLDEFDIDSLIHAFTVWVAGGCVLTPLEVEVGQGNLKTRVWGPKMGQESLEGEERVLVYRGADRPKQPCVVKDDPFQDTNIISLVFLPVHGLVTIHAGPLMSPDFGDPEWTSHALGFTKDEVENMQ